MADSDIPFQECDLKFISEDELRRHRSLQHTYKCYECFRKFSFEPRWRRHMAQEYKFPCDECGLKFIDKSIAVCHKSGVQCVVHKSKRHASSLNPSAAAVGNKCDEVDSKTEAYVEKEEARNSSVQNAILDEPISRNG